MHVSNVMLPCAGPPKNVGIHECSRCLIGATPELNGLVHVSQTRSKHWKEREDEIFAIVGWEG
jgi:hypothetical protein